MDSLQQWWDLAQVAGAGATLVLGPVSYLLWKQHKDDLKYMRERDESMLTVLNTLSNNLGKQNDHHKAVVDHITSAVDTIKEHVDNRTGT